MPRHGWETGPEILETSQDVVAHGLPSPRLSRWADEGAPGPPHAVIKKISPLGRKTLQLVLVLELGARAARAGLYGVEPVTRYVCMI